MIPHLDPTITLGNIFSVIAFTVMAIIAWRDMNWRVKNLEVWRREHMLDADARDRLLQNIDKILYHVTGGNDGNPGERRKR